MFDIGWTELLVIAVVLIVVVGPKDLPPMLRAFGKMTANFRKMAGEFRTQFNEALRESEMDDVRKTISDAQRLNPTSALRDAINPLRQMGQEIRSDLENATRVASRPAEEAPRVTVEDVEAQHAIEGAETMPEAVVAPADAVPTAAAVQPAPVTSGQTAPVAPAQAASAPSAPAMAPAAEPKPAASPVATGASPAAPASVAAIESPAAAGKAKPVRKASAKAKAIADATDAVTPDAGSARAKRARNTTAEADPDAPKATRRRASKKTDTAEGEA